MFAPLPNGTPHAQPIPVSETDLHNLIFGARRGLIALGTDDLEATAASIVRAERQRQALAEFAARQRAAADSAPESTEAVLGQAGA